jgi:hypothetical protein
MRSQSEVRVGHVAGWGIGFGEPALVSLSSWTEHIYWLCRQTWFDLDHVDLSPGRRDYLQYKFGTVKVLNGRNNFSIPWLVQM